MKWYRPTQAFNEISDTIDASITRLQLAVFAALIIAGLALFVAIGKDL